MDRRSKLRLFFIACVLLLAAPPAQAACGAPAANAGARDYSAPNMRFCDGTNWSNFITDGTLGTCAGLGGKIEFDTAVNAYKYCNNTNYLKIRQPSSCTLANPTYLNKVTSATYLDLFTSIVTSADGTKAYVLGQYLNKLSVYDISSPTAPTFLGSVTHANLNDSVDAAGYGNYVFAIGRGQDNVVVVDVSNPAAPAYVTRVQATTISEMNNIWGIALSPNGQYAYTVSWSSGASSNKCFLHTINISTPTSPSLVASLNLTDGGMGGSDQFCNQVQVRKGYAFVTFGEGRLAALSLANPASPAFTSSISHANLSQAHALDFSDDGNYAFASTSTNSRLTVINITNPASMTYVTSVQNATYMNGSYGLRVEGKYAIVSGQTSDAIAIYDISTPASPTLAGNYVSAANLNGANDIAIVGRYAFVGGADGDTLAALDLACKPDTPNAGLCSSTNAINYFSAEKSLAYCDGEKWRVMATPACSGVMVGGYCWYYGANSASCDTACSTHGGCVLAGIRDYAGSNGTDANCAAVLDALGAPAGNVTTSGVNAAGCAFFLTGPTRFRNTLTTTCAETYTNDRRACSCAN